jgi:hypothetical protein
LCSGEIESILGDTGTLSFDYKCKECNPEIIISISDMVLESSFYIELKNSKFLKDYLIGKVKAERGPTFIMLTELFPDISF